jgi:integrase
MKQKLTMYCARHSWATMAKDLKISLDVISRAMGHNNLRTTEIYLKSIESNAIDKANSKIIGKI